MCNQTYTLTDPDTLEGNGTLSIYSDVEHPGHMLGNVPDWDKDNDDLPEPGPKPIFCNPMNTHVHRVGLLPSCEPPKK